MNAPQGIKGDGGRGFAFLNITQFFNAFNDNVLKGVLMFGTAASGIWFSQVGEGGQAYASLALAVPFVILSGFAGQFSDRFSKRDVTVIVKLTEVLIGGLALIGFLMTNLWVVLTAMVLISIQSTFFGPAKYGILPEIIEEKRLSRANGTLNMFTYMAAILGGAAAGPLYDAYAPNAETNPDGIPILWLPGVVIVAIGILGMIASRGVTRVTAQNPTLKIRLILFKPYWEIWQLVRGSTLAAALLAWSFFYLIVAGLAILILPDYQGLLKISATMTALLTAVLGLAIGAGDYTAGRLSGHGVRPGMIPFGALGTTAAMFLLAVMPLNYILVAICLGVAGFLAGFLMVPLQTLIQLLSPKEKRGQVMGLWNMGSFGGVIVGNFIFLGLKRGLSMGSQDIFFVCGGLGLLLLLLLLTGWQERFAEAAAEYNDS